MAACRFIEEALDVPLGDSFRLSDGESSEVEYFYSSSYFKMSIRQYFTRYYYEPQPRGHAIGAVATREANESVECALEKQASQRKAQKRKVHTHFGQDWPRMGMPPPQSHRFLTRKVL